MFELAVPFLVDSVSQERPAQPAERLEEPPEATPEVSLANPINGNVRPTISASKSLTDVMDPVLWEMPWGPDCPDGSDENVKDCCALGLYDDAYCPGKKSSCPNGKCIKASYYCDGSRHNTGANWGPDCADGSDEIK